MLAFEREELINAGRPDLAERVRHVAEIEVDGAGYDIESFTASGAKKYIEVKTTTGDKDADFFLTSNELLFSKEHPYEYYLYRVYNFDEEHRKGEFFAVGGSLDRYFRLLPIQFRVTLNLRE